MQYLIAVWKLSILWKYEGKFSLKTRRKFLCFNSDRVFILFSHIYRDRLVLLDNSHGCCSAKTTLSLPRTKAPAHYQSANINRVDITAVPVGDIFKVRTDLSTFTRTNNFARTNALVWQRFCFDALNTHARTHARNTIHYLSDSTNNLRTKQRSIWTCLRN